MTDLPGQEAHIRIAAELRDQTMVVTIMENITHQTRQDALLRMVGLDPATDSFTDAIAVVEALVQFYNEHES